MRLIVLSLLLLSNFVPCCLAQSLSSENSIWFVNMQTVEHPLAEVSLAGLADTSALPESNSYSSSSMYASAAIAAAPVAVEPISPMVRIARPSENTNTAMKHERLWLSLSIAQHASAAFDAWSTQESISSGRGYEQNPLLKPFAKSAAIYPVSQGLPIGLDYLSRRMRRSSNGFARKMWWAPQSVSTAVYIWAGTQNLRVAYSR